MLTRALLPSAAKMIKSFLSKNKKIAKKDYLIMRVIGRRNDWKTVFKMKRMETKIMKITQPIQYYANSLAQTTQYILAQTTTLLSNMIV